jgi:phosphatidylserine synthase 2
MRLGDDSLGKPITKEMHTYDDNCEFEWVNIWDNLDHYFLSHCFNWFVAASILRDAWILNLWSVYDELIEISWQHILPHFRECWWDHVFLDVLLSNTVFIFLGLFVLKLFRVELYDWLGRTGKSSPLQWEIWTKYHNYYHPPL